MKLLFSGIFDESKASKEMHSLGLLGSMSATPSMPKTVNATGENNVLIDQLSSAQALPHPIGSSIELTGTTAHQTVEESSFKSESHILIIQDLPNKFPQLTTRKNI